VTVSEFAAWRANERPLLDPTARPYRVKPRIGFDDPGDHFCHLAPAVSRDRIGDQARVSEEADAHERISRRAITRSVDVNCRWAVPLHMHHALAGAAEVRPASGESQVRSEK
jgi:hypothetical protein